VAPALVNDELRLLAKIAPRAAIPNEPPMLRTKVDAPVAAPRLLRDTLFCATSETVCVRQPRPARRNRAEGARRADALLSDPEAVRL
jgi:hypothetical protein